MKGVLLFLFGIVALRTYGQYQFIAPVPGSVNQNPERCILIREGHELNADVINQKSFFSIRGSKSGNHDFSLTLSNDHKTIILQPAIPFGYSELVTFSVLHSLQSADGIPVPPISFSFSTHPDYSTSTIQRMHEAILKIASDEIPSAENTRAASAEGASILSVTTNTNPNPGDVFYDYQEGFPILGSPKRTACYLVKSNGDSLFSHHGIGVIADFKINHNGYLTFLDLASGSFRMYDSSYHFVRSFSAVNGYTTDVHEFQIYPDGHYYLIGDEAEIIDMTKYNANYNPNAAVIGSVIQEFDAGDHLIFEWRSFDHVDVTEALHQDLAGGYIDYIHTNSIEEDTDGNIIVSQRHLDQIDKINVKTGEFIWRLGGIENQFTFLNDSLKFNYQHDARLLPNGHLTIFDNGNFNPQPVSSTAKEYALDAVNKTVTLVWSYNHPLINGIHVYGSAMGSVQRFSNGGTFINWGWIQNNGSIPNMTEIDSTGRIVWEAKVTPGLYNVVYRAYRFVWTPCARVSPQTMNAVNLSATGATLEWSNATNAASYQIQYKDSGNMVWQNADLDSSGDTSFVLNGLQPSTVYEWCMESYCSSPNPDSSHFTAIQKFSTLSITSTETINRDSFRIFPNPARHLTTISLPTLSSSIHIFLMSDLGTTLQAISIHGEKQVNVDLDPLSSGIYLVKVISGEKTFVEKLLVE